MDGVPKEIETRLDLLAVGTRFDHYCELKEIFAEGLDILETMKGTYNSVSDNKKRVELKAAVDLITTRLELLSGFERKTSANSRLAETINSIPRTHVKNDDPKPSPDPNTPPSSCDYE